MRNIITIAGVAPVGDRCLSPLTERRYENESLYFLAFGSGPIRGAN
jgi:hypothetical protein